MVLISFLFKFLYFLRKTYRKNGSAGTYFSDYLKDSSRPKAKKTLCCILMVSLIYHMCFSKYLPRGPFCYANSTTNFLRNPL